MGAGVADVFAYVARRVVMGWEWEEGVPNLVGNGSAVHESFPSPLLININNAGQLGEAEKPHHPTGQHPHPHQC